MLKNLSSLKKWIQKEHVLDVILFGSSQRGKLNPADIDLCILISDIDEKKSLDLVDSLAKITDTEDIKVQINIMTSRSFATGSGLAKTLLEEGWSIKHNKRFSETFGFHNKSLFIYSLKHFSPTQRVKFHYMLQGRYESKGILKEVHGIIIGTGTIIVPTEKEDTLKEIFDMWSVKYTIERVLVS
jgi:predicted nucleotidyltransferase